MKSKSPEAKQGNYHKAILFIVIAQASIAIMSFFVKLASDNIPASETLFFRFFIGLLFTLPLILKTKNFSFKITRSGYFILRNGAGLISILLMFYSLKFLPVSTAVLLMNTASLFIPLFVFLMFREKTALLVIVCTITGFIGVYIVLVVQQKETSNIYLAIGLVSAAFAALAYISLKVISKYESSLQIVFYFHLISSIIIPMVTAYNWVLPSWYELYLLIMVGVFGLMYQIFITKALQCTNITAITPFAFVGVIFSSMLDWIIWGNSPSVYFWIGATIIIGSVTVLTKLRTTTDLNPHLKS
ncbi:MAG: DMT family transporter [Enterobacteriaceae bacterium]